MNEADLARALELLEQVPRSPERPGFEGATHDQLVALERGLGFRVPVAYRTWLSACNGVIAGPGGIYGAGATPQFLDIAFVLSLYPQWRQARWIPVAGDGNGNQYVIDASRSQIDRDAVFFVDTMEDSLALAYIVASDLPRFLDGLLRRELGERRWPFDKEFVLGSDPEMASVHPASLLPWETR